MRFADGTLYERTITTPDGEVDVLAEVVVQGRRIELRNMAVYPRSAVPLRVGPVVLVRWARGALTELAAKGFEEVRVTGTRLSGARQGRVAGAVGRGEADRPREPHVG